jgi:hypothetical protein
MEQPPAAIEESQQPGQAPETSPTVWREIAATLGWREIATLAWAVPLLLVVGGAVAIGVSWLLGAGLYTLGHDVLEWDLPRFHGGNAADHLTFIIYGVAGCVTWAAAMFFATLIVDG